MLESYVTAFTLIDETVKAFGLNDPRPQMLHHYTSAEAARLILAGRDLWLSNCEYLNDSKEITGAAERIAQALTGRRQRASNNTRERTFCDDVLKGFESRAALYEAFVFCMSASDTPFGSLPQDVLSLWRGYGHGGRGLCLSFNFNFFHNYNDIRQASECRLSKVIYEEKVQEQVIAFIIDEGWKEFNRSNAPQSSIEATIVALMFVMPAMKHATFAEEREWRFIYVPQPSDLVVDRRQFRTTADGLIVPYYLLSDVIGLPIPRPALPIDEIATGPSPYQDLNTRSLEYLRNKATLRNSAIPYRRP